MDSLTEDVVDRCVREEARRAAEINPALMAARDLSLWGGVCGQSLARDISACQMLATVLC